jgi:chromosome segregation ATPase
MEQLATRKAQCQELASQLKRCTEKLNTQTAAVQSVKAELTETQNQLAAARALSRNKSLTLTEKAVSAERGRSQLEQQLAQQELANRQLQQQLSELQKQLEHQRAHVEARKVAAVAEQRADVLRMQEQLAQKDDVIAQLKDSMGAVQAQLASQQAKVGGMLMAQCFCSNVCFISWAAG